MNTFKKNLSLVSFGMVVVSMLAMGSGCDDTQDAARDRKTAEELTILHPAEGIFRGELTAKADGADMGPIAIETNADTEPSPAAGGYRMERMAVLNARISFGGQNPQSIQLLDGSYNPDDKTIKVSSNVVQLNGQQVRLELSATLKDNHLVGDVEIAGYTDCSGTFDLVKDAAAAAPQAQSLIREEDYASGNEPGALVYDGNAVTKDGNGPAELHLAPYSMTSDQGVLQHFLPEKYVLPTLSLPGNRPTINFQPGYFNQRNGTLEAKTNDGNSQLSCRTFGTDLLCHFRVMSNGTYQVMKNGDAATITFKLTSGSPTR